MKQIMNKSMLNLFLRLLEIIELKGMENIGLNVLIELCINFHIVRIKLTGLPNPLFFRKLS